ncbi:MAG: bacillithiol biosynthesis cysteine-adding enzyme BshC [Flavobacteriales bacterium]
MPTTSILYPKTGYFSKLVCDYLSQKNELKNFYGLFPNIENFEKQIDLKKETFSLFHRKKLVERLQFQYQNTSLSEATQKNINTLLDQKTFTVTTGHQLNLFTGPLYFLYKIFSVINLSETLNKKYPKNHFVPVYWLATEDHDFDEINYFTIFRKKVEWKKEASGAVGELDLFGLESVFNEFSELIGDNIQAQKLKTLFTEAYLKHHNLTQATRYLANQLFAEYGLVIVDGNDPVLKQEFAPFAKKELIENTSYKSITKTTKKLVEAGYHEQVFSREINLFYLKKGLRERIIKEKDVFKINNTQIKFTKKQIIEELQNHPERFSPNALLRPLYQEVVLPNLAYLGGGGELAYWFQLKDYFEELKIPFPILLLRNSVLVVSAKISKKLKKLDVPVEKLFLSPEALTSWFTKKNSDLIIDFSPQKELLKNQFKALYDIAKKTDKSFVGAVAAQEKKQLKGLENLEKRLLQAEKKQLKDKIERLLALREKLFPNNNLQERIINFSEFYLEFGDDKFQKLISNLDPLSIVFTVLKM